MDEGQLTFDDDAAFSGVPKRASKLVLAPPEGDQLAFAAGDKSLVRDDEGLYARLVHRHSARKAYYVGRYCDIVGKAMARQWPERWWIELFAGPGRLLEHETGRFLPGSPVGALNIEVPFTGYIFADLSDICVSCLGARTAGRDNVHVMHGDANDVGLLDAIAGIVPRNALAILYADPEGLDLHLETIRFFTARWPHLDLLLNLPTAGVVRYLRAGREERAVPVLGHTRPAELVQAPQGRHYGPDVRTFFQRQLEGMGYEHFRVEPILLEGRNVPIYDLLLASRHERAAHFFDAAVSIRPDGQRALFM